MVMLTNSSVTAFDDFKSYRCDADVLIAVFFQFRIIDVFFFLGARVKKFKNVFYYSPSLKQFFVKLIVWRRKFILSVNKRKIFLLHFFFSWGFLI